MLRYATYFAILFAAICVADRECAADDPVPLPRRLDPYFAPSPPPPEVNADTGLPQYWYTTGPAPFFGSPYVGWGYGYGYGGYYRGGYGYGFGYPGRWGYGLRYGEFYNGPFAGFYGPAQRVPGYRTYGPYSPQFPAMSAPEVLAQPGIVTPPVVAPGVVAPPLEAPLPSLGP